MIALASTVRFAGGREAARLHERAGAIFAGVRRLPAAERAAALDETCGSDARLRSEVLSLLHAEAFADLDAEGLGVRLRDRALRLLHAPTATSPSPSRLGG